MGIFGSVLKIGGSLLSAGAGKKAAKKAAKIAGKAAKENNALAREYEAKFSANFSPFLNRGNAAGDMMNALLGIGGGYGGEGGAGMTPDEQVSAIMLEVGPKRTAQFNNWLKSNPNATAEQKLNFIRGIAHPDEAAMLQSNARTGPNFGRNALNPQAAFDQFRNSTGYQFRVNEGENALNQGYAAQGALRSGKAQKDFMRFGQGIASDEFGRYMGYLGNQQSLGLNAAGGMAGIGANALGNITNNNWQAAGVKGNAALQIGGINQAMWSDIAKEAGSIGKSIFGSSF